MSILSVTTGDRNCRYLAAPQSSTQFTQFGSHLAALGIELPHSMSLRTLVQRGWIRPRLRIELPRSALLAWTNFPEHPMLGDEACPADQRWALEAWCAATCSTPEEHRPDSKLWMHWLDDADDCTMPRARQHAIDPAAAEPPSFLHPRRQPAVLPWIDFFADWQAYHVAELVHMAEFSVHGVTDQFGSCDTIARRHTERFDARAKELASRWEERGAFFGDLASYRTILAHCTTRDTFTRDTRLGARSWAEQRGINADAIRTGVCDVLLRLWQRWADSPPVRSPKLMHRLQQDIQYAVRLLWNLTDEPVDPFAPVWYWKHFSRGDWAKLIDALPYEEWHARRDFARLAVHYQRATPHPLLLGENQFAAVLTKHWPSCPPLRRFCLAWVRLHEEMRGRDRDLPADMTIAANERIEQFNLIALHTERVLRHVHEALCPRGPGDDQVEVGPLMRGAIQRAVHVVAKSHQNGACKRVGELLDAKNPKNTKLKRMPAATDAVFTPMDVNSGSLEADQVVAAHLNALVARNYAAHHAYLDDELIYPTRDETKPHAGSMLMSSCLLVVIAALHSLPPAAPSTFP